MLGLFAPGAPQSCADAYADLRVRLAGVRSVLYDTHHADSGLPDEFYSSLGISRTGRVRLDVDAGPGQHTITETDGRRVQNLDNVDSFNVALTPARRRIFWLPGFESLSDPGAKVEGIGDVRTKDGALLLSLRVYDQNFTLYLDPKTRRPLGYATGGATTMYERSRRDGNVIDVASLRYNVPVLGAPIPTPMPAATVLARARAALRGASEVRIVRYRYTLRDGRPLPRRWSDEFEGRLAGNVRRDAIVIRGRGSYRRESGDETVTSNGTTVIRQRKGRAAVRSRAPRRGLPERIAGLETLFVPTPTPLSRGIIPVEIVHALGHELTPSYFLPLGTATLRVTAADGLPGEIFEGRTILVFQYPRRGEVPRDPITGN